MSFWKNFGFHSASAIDSLLEEKGADLTLEELMDEPELIQECKSQNRKLIELFAYLFIIFFFSSRLFLCGMWLF